MKKMRMEAVRGSLVVFKMIINSKSDKVISVTDLVKLERLIKRIKVVRESPWTLKIFSNS